MNTITSQTVISELKGKIEMAKTLILNSSESACVASSIGGLYCIVEDGKGINGTCVGLESLSPHIMTAENAAKKIKITDASNGRGKIIFYPTLLKVYCNSLITKFQETIDFLESRNIDINIEQK